MKFFSLHWWLTCIAWTWMWKQIFRSRQAWRDHNEFMRKLRERN